MSDAPENSQLQLQYNIVIVIKVINTRAIAILVIVTVINSKLLLRL